MDNCRNEGKQRGEAGFDQSCEQRIELMHGGLGSHNEVRDFSQISVYKTEKILALWERFKWRERKLT